MRVAIYFTPPHDSPLASTAKDWLSCEEVEGIDADLLLALLESPRKYGFHATIKAPFYIKNGFELEDIEKEIYSFAAEQCVFSMPPLQLGSLGNFYCLQPRGHSAQLNQLAAAIVTGCDRFRKTATTEELARRREKGLSAQQESLLRKWGYPYVLQEFVYHMTLTGPVAEDGPHDLLVKELQNRFLPLLTHPLAFDALTICTQEGEHPFVEYKRIPFQITC